MLGQSKKSRKRILTRNGLIQLLILGLLASRTVKKINVLLFKTPSSCYFIIAVLTEYYSSKPVSSPNVTLVPCPDNWKHCAQSDFYKNDMLITLCIY